jgi:hypothetical protein
MNLNDTKQKGSVMIMVMILFVVLSLSISFGLITPAIRSHKVAQNLIYGKQSYFVAESGIEDIVYRLKKAMAVSSSEVLFLGTHQATTTLTDLGSNQREIQSVGNTKNRIRNIGARIIAGDGVSFSYGVMVGSGGFILNQNAGVNGSVYSNGNIIGANGAVITGTAYAANSAPLSADQSNVTPIPPTSSITFGDASGTEDFAQSFQVSTSGQINKIRIYLKKDGAPASGTIRIVSDSSGSPSTTVVASGALTNSLVSTSYGWVDIPMTTNPELYAGTTYWLVADVSTGNSSKNYIIGANNSYSNGVARLGKYSGTWGATQANDGYFEIYLGGLNSSISDVTIGTVGEGGDASAYQITNVNVVGGLYCQIGSGNNKSCDTNQPLPSAQPYPISDANILDWKADAETGGTITGNYTVNGSVTMGPKKITGNLTLGLNSILTLTGAIWVEGSVVVSNNGLIKLDPSFGDSSSLIITDGIVTISNNASFEGSDPDNDKSFVMVLTTSSDSNAITVGNNAGAVILNAQNGTLRFSNNSSANEAVAKTVILENGAYVEYKTGLANTNFVTGPQGSWDILSWGE